MIELRCECNKLLGMTNTNPVEDQKSAVKPNILRLWCTRCKKETKFLLDNK